MHFPFGQLHYLGQLDQTTLILMILMTSISLLSLISLPFDHMYSTRDFLQEMEPWCYDLNFPFGQPHSLGPIMQTTLISNSWMTLMSLLYLPFEH